jgi:polyferredoxin
MSKIDLALVDDAATSFYVSERKIYPRDVSGRYDRLRKIAVFWLLGMFYGFPWLRWDGRQAVLFDLPARKFHVFGLTVLAAGLPLLALLLIIAASRAVLRHRAGRAPVVRLCLSSRRYGPRPSCGWSAGPRATATRA